MAKSMKNQYNTPLTKNQEASFKEWAKKNDRLKDLHDYDMRGAWKEMTPAQRERSTEGQHFSDKYKKPNHQTFSDESIYHGKDGHYGGHWSHEYGTSVFTPHESQRSPKRDAERRAYFDKYEIGSGLRQND